MEQFTVVLVVLFAAFFIGCPVLGAISQRRRGPDNAAEPGPKDLHRARRKLSTVTACSSVGDVGKGVGGGGGGGKSVFGHYYYRRPSSLFCGPEQHQKQADDTEANAAQLDLGECPICIGPLVPEPAHVEDGRNAREILDGVTTTLSTPAAAVTAAATTPTATCKGGDGAAAVADAGAAEGSSRRNNAAGDDAGTPCADNTSTSATTAGPLAALLSPRRFLPERRYEPPVRTDQAGSSRRDNDHDDDDNNDSHVTATGLAAGDEGEDKDRDKWWAKYKRQWSDRATARQKADDDDILSLNTCGHAFHSKCLASWFLIDRYDCPVCRAVYYTKRRPSLPARVVSSVVPSPRLPSSSGMVMGFAAPP